MREKHVTNVWWFRGLVLATALLALATGFCFFDQHHDGTSHDGARSDLCLGMLAILFAIVPLVRPLAVGWAVQLSLARPHTAPLHIPDPPPKLS